MAARSSISRCTALATSTGCSSDLKARANAPSTMPSSRRSKRCRTPTRAASLRLLRTRCYPGYECTWGRANLSPRPGGWRNGRRARFRSVCPKGCEGSNPSSPTVQLACGNAGQFRLIWGPREVVRFTYANKRANDRRVTSMRKPRGHIRKRPFGYEIAVPEGRDPITQRYQYRYGYAATEEEAETVRERMVAEITAGREPRTKATLGQLLDEMLAAADLDFTTRGM